MSNDRIHNAQLRSRIVSPEQAAALIQHGETVAMSGFTGSGYPKVVPLALAARIEQAHEADTPFQIQVWTGASTAPELDGALAKVDGIELRLPYQSDPEARRQINEGRIEYIDTHLSHVAQQAWFGRFDLVGFKLVRDDLAIDGVGLSEAPRDAIKRCHGVAVERHQAIGWLRGAHRLYSKVDTST